MENSAISVCLFLLLRLSASLVTANQSGVTTSPHQPPVDATQAPEEENSTAAGGGTGTRPSTGADPADPFFPVPDNGTRADCLIDTEMGLIAVASAGALILCLLATTVALAGQVCYLQRRACAVGPRRSRSKADLASAAAAGYWGAAADRSEAEGLVGPCDGASVMLEEVRADRELEEGGMRRKPGEARPEAEVGLLEGVEESSDGGGQEGGPRAPRASSSSRDSCMDNPRDLEDMPLVV